MRRLISDDRGVSAVLVAILAVVLFGAAAIAIDLGVLYEERRQLQNGADAAALAVGWECAQNGIGSTNCPDDDTFAALDPAVTAYATVFANGNARDGAATVLGTSEIKTEEGWVQVDLESESAIPPLFGGLLGAGATTVRASAAVEFEAGGFSPIAFGTCELVDLVGASRVLGFWERNNGRTEVSLESPGNQWSFVRTDPATFLGEDGTTNVTGTEAHLGRILFNYGAGLQLAGDGDDDIDNIVDFRESNTEIDDDDDWPEGEQLIGFQSGQPVNPECQPNSGGDKAGDAASGNFGWIATDDCAVDLPNSGLDALWIEAQQGSVDTQVGCGPDDFSGTLQMLVFDEAADVNTNSNSADATAILASPLCPIDGNGNITCYHAAYIVEFAVAGWKLSFPGYTAPGCSLATGNGDCVQGVVTDVFPISRAEDELPEFVRLIEPLPNP